MQAQASSRTCCVKAATQCPRNFSSLAGTRDTVSLFFVCLRDSSLRAVRFVYVYVMYYSYVVRFRTCLRSHIKKKEHALYGAHYKAAAGPAVAPTMMKFGDDE